MLLKRGPVQMMRLGCRMPRLQRRQSSTSISHERLEQLLVAEISALAMLPTATFTVEDFADSTCLIENARRLHEEVPIRLAKRIRRLEAAPMNLCRDSNVMGVRDMYIDCFKQLRLAAVPDCDETNAVFTKMLNDIRERDTDSVPTIGAAVQMLKKDKTPTADEEGKINQFLNEFNWRRIDTRMIMGQHIAMHTDRPGYIGMIALDCNLEEIVQLAIDDADMLCDRHMGASPSVDVQIFKQGPFAYVPAFLHHMMFEIIKNAMKATVQKHENREGGLPDVKIVLSIPEDGEDLLIKVHDKGGGMDSHTLAKIWDYFFTTADKHIDLSDTSLQSGAHGYTVPLAGFGHGLPLSRLYAQYFGGDIEVVSMINYGTDVYFNLKRLDPELHLSGPAR